MMRSLVLIPLALLGGCAALKSPETVDTMRLRPVFAAPTAPLRAGGVSVAPVEASGEVAGRRYVYVATSEPQLLRQAATLFWEVPPPETMGHALVEALRTHFAGMDAGPFDRHLSARLLRFEEVTGAGAGAGGAQAVVALEATLTGAATISATARYCRATPIAASGSGARAAAFQDGVAALAAAVASDVAAGRLTGSDC